MQHKKLFLLAAIPPGLVLLGLVMGTSEPVPAKTAKEGRAGWNKLSPAARHVLEEQGTERAFTGEFVKHKKKGTYTCGRCNAPLFASSTKFESGSGWPAFDDALPGAVKEVRDADGFRTEIRCARCEAHLGHVFRGEGFTQADTRHCVNSLALGFTEAPRQEAYFAGGCFWGVEALLEAEPGVLEVTSGYMGGKIKDPGYKAVITGLTGHAETVRVIFNPQRTSFERLARSCFEIHDPTQKDGQGPDIGNQYRSAVFVTDSEQERVTYKLIGELKKKGFKVVTEVEPASAFWPAEAYHQDYYARTGKAPYCHARVKRF